jgi:hypothetical protein
VEEGSRTVGMGAGSVSGAGAVEVEPGAAATRAALGAGSVHPDRRTVGLNQPVESGALPHPLPLTFR